MAAAISVIKPIRGRSNPLWESGEIQSIGCESVAGIKVGQFCAKIDPRPFQASIERATTARAAAATRRVTTSSVIAAASGQFRTGRKTWNAVLSLPFRCALPELLHHSPSGQNRRSAGETISKRPNRCLTNRSATRSLGRTGNARPLKRSSDRHVALDSESPWTSISVAAAFALGTVGIFIAANRTCKKIIGCHAHVAFHATPAAPLP